MNPILPLTHGATRPGADTRSALGPGYQVGASERLLELAMSTVRKPAADHS